MGIERLTPRAVARLRMHAAVAGRPAILVISAIDEAELVLLAECLVVAVLGRGSVNSVSGLTLREIEVLRLTAEGLGTVEIAKETHCSERTVKNIVHGAVNRYQLRNRTHAVAYAMRRTHLSATDRRGHCRRPDGEPGQHNLVSSSQAARNSTRKEQRCRIAAPGT
jgi:DNA-binding CsgD family transcriptional regulator